MFQYIKNELNKRKFLKNSVLHERGIAYLTEGYCGTRINLRYELWLNNIPIGLLNHFRGDKGQLYNSRDYAYGYPKILAAKFVSENFVLLKKGAQTDKQSENPESNLQSEISFNSIFYNRRPISFIFVEWEDGDWARPDAMILKKYPKVRELAFNYSLKNDLDLSITNQHLPSYRSFSVIRDNAHKRNDRIGSVFTVPFNSNTWIGKNLFKESMEFPNKRLAANWVALSSLGGWKNAKEYFTLNELNF